MPNGGAEDKPAMCYPYATVIPVKPVPCREKLLFYSVSEVPIEAVKCFSSLEEFLRCGHAVSIQFLEMLDHVPPGDGQLYF